MNLPRLYDLLLSRSNAAGEISLPAWPDIAAAAEVPETEDTTAFRALVEKGAVKREPVANTFGDYRYFIQRPIDGQDDAFRTCLRTVGATVAWCASDHCGAALQTA